MISKCCARKLNQKHKFNNLFLARLTSVFAIYRGLMVLYLLISFRYLGLSSVRLLLILSLYMLAFTFSIQHFQGLALGKDPATWKFRILFYYWFYLKHWICLNHLNQVLGPRPPMFDSFDKDHSRVTEV